MLMGKISLFSGDLPEHTVGPRFAFLAERFPHRAPCYTLSPLI